ncbi:hypothetical protein [Paenibacillus sp. N3.4]|uniref:hypothetical protein n=1 Tax=Paenibacillus sp. N3.4 TaxID=2603222 RepID=UPI00164FF8F4|nr:hypothetical protein [Paenibacillus sp. N3.4]
MKLVNKRSTNKRLSRKFIAKSAKSSTRSELYWHKWGIRAGKADAATHSTSQESYQKRALNTYWLKRMKSNLFHPSSRHYRAASKGYVAGFCQASGMPMTDWVLLPTEDRLQLLSV